MLPTKRIPTHPGVMLAEEFLNPMGLTQSRLAAHIGVPLQRVNEIVKGETWRHARHGSFALGRPGDDR